VLQHAGADYDESIIPGYRDLSKVLSNRSEVFDNQMMNVEKKVQVDMKAEKEIQLRKCSGQFTAAEDNLLLRGVNLYGEKEWTQVSHRFLPDRSISTVANRYWRLCYFIYRANEVAIDERGNLATPPNYICGIADYDEKAIVDTLKPVKPPALYNIYRWSLEEDIAILKSVPLMGRYFAEISKRFLKHRDRGALRKRYQVLERRVKGSVNREKKSITRVKKSMREIEKKTRSTLMPKLAKGRGWSVGDSLQLPKQKKIPLSELEQSPLTTRGQHVYQAFGTQAFNPQIFQALNPLTQVPNSMIITPMVNPKICLNTQLPLTLPRFPPPTRLPATLPSFPPSTMNVDPSTNFHQISASARDGVSSDNKNVDAVMTVGLTREVYAAIKASRQAKK